MSLAVNPHTSWLHAYKLFLLDKDESFILKLAPLILILGSPEVIVSNHLPVVGEVIDVGALSVTALVIFRTYSAVKRHRQPVHS